MIDDLFRDLAVMVSDSKPDSMFTGNVANGVNTETNENYYEFIVPGIDPSDIKVHVKQGRQSVLLSVEGAGETLSGKKVKYFNGVTFPGVLLANGVDANKLIRCEYSRGILTVYIKRQLLPEPISAEIPIKSVEEK